MCTLTHFAHPVMPYLQTSSTTPAARQHSADRNDDGVVTARFQVILAGNAFFHIKEISTGCVRGFRANHNEACALARSLESRA